MARGGARPNTGPKKGSKHKKTIQEALEAEEYRRFLREQVIKNKGTMIAAQISKANEGDTISFKELNDRAFGRSPEKLEVDNKGEIVFKIMKYGDRDSIRIPSSQVSSSDSQSVGRGTKESGVGSSSEKRER